MRARLITTAIALSLVAAACGGDSDTADPSTSTSLAVTTTTTGSPPTSTTVPPATSTTATTTTTTTTVAPTTTTTTVPTRYVVTDPSIFPAESLPGSNGASGSGCTPGAGDLPSGVWYGTIRATRPGSLDFDLACFYFGEIAWEIAAEVGEQANNDYWIVNENPALRTVPVAAKAMVWSIPANLTDEMVSLFYESEWPPDWERAYAECPGDGCGVWLYINAGVVDEIVEQYVP
ncbi:MAG: hypothetical protein ACR2OI_07340 [Acidimicrobiia bacterium]